MQSIFAAMFEEEKQELTPAFSEILSYASA